MIGGIIAAASTIGSSIYSGIKSAKANRQRKQELLREKAENNDWYNRRYNEDATQRADAQRLLRLPQEAIRNRNKQVAGTQAVVGGTEESVAAEKEANAKAMSDTASAIVAQGEARKDNIEESYRNQNRMLNNELDNMEAQPAENIANAGAQAIQAMGSIANAIDSTDGKSKSADTAKPATATSTPTTATSAPAVETPETPTAKTPETPAAEPPQNLPNPNDLKIARENRGYF